MKKVEPDEGRAGEHTTVTVSGEHLQNPSSVKFGGKSGTELVSISAAEVRVKSPALEAGKVDVVVSTIGGESTKGAGDQFTYVVRRRFAAEGVLDLSHGGQRRAARSSRSGAKASLRPRASFSARSRSERREGTSSTEITVSSPPHGAGAAGSS